MAVIKQTKREIETAEKKRKIVESAISLFQEHGYEKTTIADISEVTGFSVGSIYNFFGNKAGILCDLTLEIFLKSVRNNFYNLDVIDDPKKIITNYYMSICVELEKYGWEIASVGIDATSQEYFHGGQQMYWDFSMQPLIEFLQKVDESGRWKLTESPGKAAEAIQMMYMGVWVTWIKFPIRESLAEAMKDNISLLLDKLIK